MNDIELFKILGSIVVDSDKANKDIAETDSKAGKLAGKLKSGMGTAAKWGAGIAGAAAAGATAMFGMAKKSAGVTDEIDKMSQKIGISRKGFQEYSYILSQNGTDINVLQRGFKTLTDRMDESVKGTGKGAEAFKALGLSAEDLNGNLKSQEQMFEESAKALMNMPEGAEKSALAFDLFGKAGQELMPLLNGTAEDMDELRQAAHDMGLVLSDEAVDAGAEFTDTMDNVQRSMGAIGAKIGAELMPMFNDFLNWILDHMPEIQAVVGVVFDAIGVFVGVVVDIFKDYLLPVFQSIFDWTKENWPTIQSVIKGVFNAIKTVWESVLKPVLGVLLDVFKSIMNWTKENWPTIQKVFQTVFETMGELWRNELKPVLDILWDLFKQIVSWVMSQWPTISSVFQTVFGTIKKAWDSVLKPVVTLLWNTFKKIVTWVSASWPTISKVFDTVFGAIKTVWTRVLKPVLDFLLDLLGEIVDFVTNVFSGVAGIFETAFSKIGKAVEKVTGFFDKFISAIKTAWDWLTKWNKTEAKDKNPKYGGGVDGSHRSGLTRVPFDGYVAELHKGERVLTANESREYNRGTGKGISNNFNISQLVVREEADVKKIARELHNMQQRSNRGRGLSPA